MHPHRFQLINPMQNRGHFVRGKMTGEICILSRTQIWFFYAAAAVGWIFSEAAGNFILPRRRTDTTPFLIANNPISTQHSKKREKFIV